MTGSPRKNWDRLFRWGPSLTVKSLFVYVLDVGLAEVPVEQLEQRESWSYRQLTRVGDQIRHGKPSGVLPLGTAGNLAKGHEPLPGIDLKLATLKSVQLKIQADVAYVQDARAEPGRELERLDDTNHGSDDVQRLARLPARVRAPHS